MKRFESMVDSQEMQNSSADARLNANNIHLSVAGETAGSSHSPSTFEPISRFSSRFALPVRDSQPICLIAPESYEPNYAYPLFIWLHAPQGTEREICQIMPRLSTRNYAAVGVRGPVECPQGFDWKDNSADCEEPDLDLTIDSIVERSCDRVFNAIERASKNYSINPQRIFLAGYHHGGTMAARIALMFPNRFSGAISINGPLPQGQGLLRCWHSARQVNLLVCLGQDATEFSPKSLCQQLPWVHTAGLSLHVRQYPVGNDLTTVMLSDMNQWIMEQVACSVVS
jgi:phospholipase/carboxylesterase